MPGLGLRRMLQVKRGSGAHPHLIRGVMGVQGLWADPSCDPSQ